MTRGDSRRFGLRHSSLKSRGARTVYRLLNIFVEDIGRGITPLKVVLPSAMFATLDVVHHFLENEWTTDRDVKLEMIVSG
jgi:hypothetical protein